MPHPMAASLGRASGLQPPSPRQALLRGVPACSRQQPLRSPLQAHPQLPILAAFSRVPKPGLGTLASAAPDLSPSH